MAPAFAEAVHLVYGSAAKGHMMQARARRIYSSDDALTSGPCDVDPARHAELRHAWDIEIAGNPGGGWRKPRDLQGLRAAIAGDQPVVLWGTRAFVDVVWLWWALDGLGRVGAERSRFFLARPHFDDPLATVGCLTPDVARDALTAANVITDAEWREGADLWIKFASPSPLAFDEARRNGSSAFPELTSSAEPHGAWFPRIKDGRLQLSELDEVLLGSFSESWRTAQDILQTLPETRVAQQAWTFDDYFPVERLRAWAKHGVLERDVLTDLNPFEQDRFRATDRTRALLDQGLEGAGDAPPMSVGGCHVNDSAALWVRIATDSGWRLALQTA